MGKAIVAGPLKKDRFSAASLTATVRAMPYMYVYFMGIRLVLQTLIFIFSPKSIRKANSLNTPGIISIRTTGRWRGGG